MHTAKQNEIIYDMSTLRLVDCATKRLIRISKVTESMHYALVPSFLISEIKMWCRTSLRTIFIGSKNKM